MHIGAVIKKLLIYSFICFKIKWWWWWWWWWWNHKVERFWDIGLVHNIFLSHRQSAVTKKTLTSDVYSMAVQNTYFVLFTGVTV